MPHVTTTRSATAIGLAQVVPDELPHRPPQLLGARAAADPGAGERPRLDEEATEEAGRRGRRRQRRHAAEAAAHQHPPGRGADARHLPLDLGDQLLDDVAMLAVVGGVLDEAVDGLGEGHDRRRQLAGRDQPVEDRGPRGVLEVVRAVEHDEHRVAVAAVEVEPGRQVHLGPGLAPEGGALGDALDEAPARDAVAGERPPRRLVPVGHADRVGPERVRRVVGVERVVDEVGAVAVLDLELVLQAGACGHRQREHEPPRLLAERLVGDVLGHADAEVHQPHRDHLAPVGERAPPGLDDRERRALGQALVERGGRHPVRDGDPLDGGERLHQAWTWTVRPMSSSMSRSTS